MEEDRERREGCCGHEGKQSHATVGAIYEPPEMQVDFSIPCGTMQDASILLLL